MMRALSGARCTGVRLYTLRIKIGTNQRALGELSHCWTHLRCNAAMHYNDSSMRKVHLVNGHVVHVHWIETVYVQNNLPTECSKSSIS